MNDYDYTRDRRKELGIFCYRKVLPLPVKCFGVIWKCTWVSGKSILKILGQPYKKKQYNWYAKKGDTMESY